MNVKFEINGIAFSFSSLERFPEHTKTLGQITTGFSLIEGIVGGIYGMLRHNTIEEGIKELQDLWTNKKRVDAVRLEFAKNSLTKYDSSYGDLMDRVLNFAEKRNKIAHGIWGSHPDDPHKIFRIPVKRWVPFLAKLVASGTKGNSIDEIEKLTSSIEEYDLHELHLLKSEGDALLTELFKIFNSLGQINAQGDGWLETSRA